MPLRLVTLTRSSQAKFENLQGVDNNKGTINGVTAVMPGRWGSHVGVMDLVIEQKTANGK